MVTLVFLRVSLFFYDSPRQIIDKSDLDELSYRDRRTDVLQPAEIENSGQVRGDARARDTTDAAVIRGCKIQMLGVAATIKEWFECGRDRY